MFLNASIFNDAIIAKLIRVMPFVLSAVCAAGAVAKLIGCDVAPSFYPAVSSFPAVLEPVRAGEATGSGAVLVA